MTSAATMPNLARGVAPCRAFVWRWPEWWAYGACALGWWVMAAHAIRFAHHDLCHSLPFAGELTHWLLMTYAMMLPLIGAELRAAAFASLWPRRHRAVAGVLVGYSLVWLAAGVPVALARGHDMARSYLAPTLAFLAAAAWQWTSPHARGLVGCHRAPAIAPTGPTFDRDCIRHGVRLGRACALSCWPLMAACTLTGHSMLAMVACMATGFAERRAFRPRVAIPAAGAILLAAYYGLRYAAE